MKSNTTSGWVNDGANHIQLVSWEVPEHKDILNQLKQLAKQYPTYRFDLKVWKNCTSEECLYRMQNR